MTLPELKARREQLAEAFKAAKPFSYRAIELRKELRLVTHDILKLEMKGAA